MLVQWCSSWQGGRDIEARSSGAFLAASLDVAAALPFDSTISICCPITYATASTTTATTLYYYPGIETFSAGLTAATDEAELLSDVQSYLRSLTSGAARPDFSTAWERFYRRYDRLVRRVVAGGSRHGLLVGHTEDFCQEVWKEIVVSLPRLAYCPGRGKLSSWIAVVARRKMRRLVRLAALPASRKAQTFDDVVDSLRCNQPGPEAACQMREAEDQILLALAELRSQASRLSYAVFHRRVFERQSARETALALGLTPNEVRCRQHRIHRKWHALLGASALYQDIGLMLTRRERRVCDGEDD